MAKHPPLIVGLIYKISIKDGQKTERYKARLKAVSEKGEYGYSTWTFIGKSWTRTPDKTGTFSHPRIWHESYTVEFEDLSPAGRALFLNKDSEE